MSEILCKFAADMPFMENIRKYRSLSIVGLEKNTGKTVCLNYLLWRLSQLHISTTVTSIGVDGEQVDSVFATAKPEIKLYEGMQFVTSERHYEQRRLVSRILTVDERHTALGRLVTAEVICPGKILLSGAATTAVLRQQIAESKRRGKQLTVVDGALSRLSLASPTVTEAMILATGAAVSPNLKLLISKTKFVYQLINLPEVNTALHEQLGNIESGLWGIDSENRAHDLGIVSVFLLGKEDINLFQYGNTLFASGAVSDRLLKFLCTQPQIKDITLIARDFTKFFITPEVFAEYHRRGGKLQVLQRSQLVALTFNPTSPQGYRLDSKVACAALSEALQTPVYDVMMI